jgi:hypothetical protein
VVRVGRKGVRITVEILGLPEKYRYARANSVRTEFVKSKKHGICIATTTGQEIIYPYTLNLSPGAGASETWSFCYVEEAKTWVRVVRSLLKKLDLYAGSC